MWTNTRQLQMNGLAESWINCHVTFGEWAIKNVIQLKTKSLSKMPKWCCFTDVKEMYSLGDKFKQQLLVNNVLTEWVNNAFLPLFFHLPLSRIMGSNFMSAAFHSTHVAAVTLELKKRAKQTKRVYIARTADTWKLNSFHVTAVRACLFV